MYVVSVSDSRGRVIAEFRLDPSVVTLETLAYAAYNPRILEVLLSMVPPPPPNAGLTQPSMQPPSGDVRLWVQQWLDYVSKLSSVEQRRAWLSELAVERGRQDLLEKIENAKTLAELYEIQLCLTGERPC